MAARLHGRNAVITGGSRGLGLAIARAYLREGASVVICSRSQRRVDLALEKLEESGLDATGIACDVSRLEDQKDLADYTIEKLGGFDIWVNNAAISAPYGPTVHIPPGEFIKAIKTDIFGVYYGSIVAMRHFLEKNHGKLINILGRGDKGPQSMQNAYSSSKSWVRSFTLALAEEYKNSGVGIFAFNPGMMDTDLLLDLQVIEGYEKRIQPLKTVMRLFSKPPEIPAQKAVWLASSDTDGKTGLVVRQMNTGNMLRGVLREGIRRLSGRKPRPIDIEIKSIPPAI
jgi:glucose 1-dehydrogenase